MKIAATLVLFMLPLGCRNSTQGRAAGAQSGTTFPSDTAECEALTEDLFDWVAAHRACEVDADCQPEPNRGFIYDGGSDVTCWPIVQVSASDADGFDTRIADLVAAHCHGPDDVCSGLSPEPACVNNVCGGGAI